MPTAARFERFLTKTQATTKPAKQRQRFHKQHSLVATRILQVFLAVICGGIPKPAIAHSIYLQQSALSKVVISEDSRITN